jgi:beta-lactam-binding protein with PASTA domain
VIWQSVPPGELIGKNMAVDLTVSLGEPPSSKTVPNLVGKSMGSALRELEALGLAKEQILVKYRYLPNLVPNTVVSQSVAAGKPLMDVEMIELVVSTDKIPGSN